MVFQGLLEILLSMILLGWEPFFFTLELLYIWLSLKQNVVKKQNKKRQHAWKWLLCGYLYIYKSRILNWVGHLLVVKDNLAEVWLSQRAPFFSVFSKWSSVFTVLVTKIRDRKQWNSLVVWRIWFVSSQRQHVHVSWEVTVPVKIVSLARKIPSAPPPQFVHPKQLWIWVCERKSRLFLPWSSVGNVITGYYSPETRRKPQQ